MIALIDQALPDKEVFNFNPDYEGFKDELKIIARYLPERRFYH